MKHFRGGWAVEVRGPPMATDEVNVDGNRQAKLVIEADVVSLIWMVQCTASCPARRSRRRWPSKTYSTTIRSK